MQITPMFQGVMDIENQSILGYESIIRVKKDENSFLTSDTFFQEAENRGELSIWDCHAREVSIRNAASLLKPNELLFTNSFISSIEDDLLFEGNFEKLGIPINQIVIEINHKHHLDDPDKIACMLNTYRNQGLLIALNEFGAGYSNFLLLKSLRPSFVKISRSIIDQIDRADSSFEQKLITELVKIGNQFKSPCQIIAEGIERESQLQILLNLGVKFGKGFLLQAPFAYQ